MEGHFFFDTIGVETALELPGDKYKAIIIPGYRYLSDGVVDKLDRFASSGGVVIASGRAGVATEDYENRSGCPIECLGVEKIVAVAEKLRPIYFELDGKEGFDRFADVDLIYLDGMYVYATFGERTKKRFRLVPPHPFAPPERAYYDVVTDHPCVSVCPYGKGVYVPWEPGKPPAG